jgi:outer membrane protein assembly factor BamB
VWKTPRRHLEEARQQGKRVMSYSTPLLIEVDGDHQIVSPAAEHVAAYDAMTGKELWWYRYDGFSLVARPVYGHGMVFVVGVEGPPQPALYAIRPSMRGEITADELVWRLTDGIPHVPSPLLIEDKLYVIKDDGVATCVEATSGKTLWKKRIGGNYSASPIYADGRIYFVSEEGKATIIQASAQFRTLSTNNLEGRFLASPAISGNALFLRTDEYLYCVQRQHGGR